MQERRDSTPVTVKLDKEVAKALSIFSTAKDRYLYDLLEEFIRDGLKKYGTSVESLAKVAA